MVTVVKMLSELFTFDIGWLCGMSIQIMFTVETRVRLFSAIVLLLVDLRPRSSA